MSISLLIGTVFASTPTFYFTVNKDVPTGCPPVQNFEDGNKYGPCGGGQMFTANSKYWVAISGAAGHCGKKIIAKYGTRQVELTVMDECPGCAHDNHLDMSIEALVELTGSAENACAINRLPVDIQWQFAGARSGRIAARVASKEMALPKVESQSIGVTPLLKPKEQPAAVIATVLAATSTLPIPKASQTSAPVQSYDQLNGTMGETAAAALISGSQRFGPTLVCIGSMLVLTTLIV